MIKIMHKLRDLIGKDLTLIQLDNKVRQILSPNQHNNSLLDGNTGKYIQFGEYTYKFFDIKESETRNINIQYIVKEKSLDSIIYTIIQVQEIEIF